MPVEIVGVEKAIGSLFPVRRLINSHHDDKNISPNTAGSSLMARVCLVASRNFDDPDMSNSPDCNSAAVSLEVAHNVAALKGE